MISENKKIKNATPLKYNGIQFKSQLEVMTYKTLIELGFKPYYEPTTYVVWKGFRPTIPFYTKDKHTNMLKLESKKLIDIKYIPDFILEYNSMIIILQVKGFANDTYYIKNKLFRSYLEEVYKITGQRCLYFEIYTKKQLLQAIEIFKDYDRKDKESNTVST